MSQTIQTNLVKIGVCGLGKIGLPLACVLSRKFKVCGVDINEERVQKIKDQKDFFEPQVNEYLRKYGRNLDVSTDYSFLADCNIVIIITQSPSLPSGKLDSKYVQTALKHLHVVNPNCLVAVSSTLNIGDLGKLRKIHERLVYNPEFIKQGSIIHNFLNPKFVLIGAYRQADGQQVANIWREFHNKPIYMVKPVEAEIIKLSLNVSFALGITFANMMGEMAEEFGADSNQVLDVIYNDRRDYKAGLGFGGPCFPRDVECFKEICRENDLRSGYALGDMLSSSNRYTLEKWTTSLLNTGAEKIGILGVSFKPNVPYVYDSQPLQIAQHLLANNKEVYIYDPLAEQNAKQSLHGKVYFCNSVSECVRKTQVVFIGTPNFSQVETEKKVVNPWK